MKVNWINVIVFLCTVPALIVFFLIGFWFRVFQYGFKTGITKYLGSYYDALEAAKAYDKYITINWLEHTKNDLFMV